MSRCTGPRWKSIQCRKPRKRLKKRVRSKLYDTEIL
jgi:hypothetical protein